MLVLSSLGCALLFYMLPTSEDSPGAIRIRSLADLPTQIPANPAVEVAADAAQPAEAAPEALLAQAEPPAEAQPDETMSDAAPVDMGQSPAAEMASEPAFPAPAEPGLEAPPAEIAQGETAPVAPVEAIEPTPTLHL